MIDINTLQDELTKEQIKGKIYEQELAIPTNVHIWRKLQVTDKNSLGLIFKLQNIQRKIIEQ